MVIGAFFQRIKREGLEADHPLASSVEVKNLAQGNLIFLSELKTCC
jgi:hypothetical protein